MEVRVFVNIDVKPFCTKLVFPVGVPTDGYVRIIFGNFSETCIKGSLNRQDLNHTDACQVVAAVSDKVFVRSPSVNGEPICTLEASTLPDDLGKESQHSQQVCNGVSDVDLEASLGPTPDSPLKGGSTRELSRKDRRKQKIPVKIRLQRSPVKNFASAISGTTRKSDRKRNPSCVHYTDNSGNEEGRKDCADRSCGRSRSPRSVKSSRVSRDIKGGASNKVTNRASTVAPIKIKALKQRSKEKKTDDKATEQVLYDSNECDKTFTSASKHHNNSLCQMAKGERPFKCLQCSKAFLSKAAMGRHQSKHSKSVPHTCEQCSKEFATLEQLLEHLQTHKDYRCECCSQLYLSQRGLRKHLSQSHKKEGVSKQAVLMDDVLEHCRTECEDEYTEHKCQQCELVYEHEEALAAHTVQAHPNHQVFPCDSCRKVFTDHDLLQAHLRKHMEIKSGTNLGDQIYLCNICNKELKSLSTLRVHVQSHNKVRSFQCDICQAKYTTAGNLRKHRKIHDTTQKYKCSQCPKEFTNGNYMLKHIKRVHTRDFKYGCSYCPKRFQEKKRYQQHVVLMHAGELTEDDYASMTLVKKLQCGQCTFTTYSAKSFRQHEVTHTGKYPHMCSECNKGFTFRFELTKHVRCIHNAQSFRCDRCKRTFTAEEVYKVHKEHHDKGLGITCKECGNMYETQGHYEQHMQAHSKDLPYECVICKKRFALTRSLNLHKLSHDKHKAPRLRAYNGNRNWDYYCELCKVYYKYGSSLVAHRVCVHGNGPQTNCPYCDKKFNSRLTLSMHLRTHTRERPMRCNYCGKTFRVWNSLKRHVVTNHTKDFKLFCALCNKGFVSKSYLKVHLKSAHKAVMAGTSKRKRLPEISASMSTGTRSNVPQKPLVVIPMPAKVNREAGSLLRSRTSGIFLVAAETEMTAIASQALQPLQSQLLGEELSEQQVPQQKMPRQKLPQQHQHPENQSVQQLQPQLQQQLQLQQLQLRQVQLQQLQPQQQHTQQREFFEVQQIQHLEGETYSLMLL